MLLTFLKQAGDWVHGMLYNWLENHIYYFSPNCVRLLFTCRIV